MTSSVAPQVHYWARQSTRRVEGRTVQVAVALCLGFFGAVVFIPGTTPAGKPKMICLGAATAHTASAATNAALRQAQVRLTKLLARGTVH